MYLKDPRKAEALNSLNKILPANTVSSIGKEVSKTKDLQLSLSTATTLKGIIQDKVNKDYRFADNLDVYLFAIGILTFPDRDFTFTDLCRVDSFCDGVTPSIAKLKSLGLTQMASIKKKLSNDVIEVTDRRVDSPNSVGLSSDTTVVHESSNIFGKLSSLLSSSFEKK